MLRHSLSVVFCLLLVTATACVGTPDDAASLGAGAPLVQRSDAGLVEATVSLAEAKLDRGPHDFQVDLSAPSSNATPELVSFVAAMPGHGHRVVAGEIALEDDAYHVRDFDLFMSGRWQVTLGVALADRTDSVEFALDVP